MGEKTKIQIKKKALGILVGLVIIGGVAVSRWGRSYLDHIPYSRHSFTVTELIHPPKASEDETITVEIHAFSRSGFSEDDLYLCKSVLGKRVSGGFYYYLDPKGGYIQALVPVVRNISLSFACPGNWTLRINEYTSTILII
ncbi:hypothetical protein [Candidatus Lokiarchaeum ossiferum]|uniref:hypothetical protein n=1 Tax=Candidatus Lokiarchaeum ossiferum TaxID=2951803 RepID=UPI00352D75ED